MKILRVKLKYIVGLVFALILCYYIKYSFYDYMNIRKEEQNEIIIASVVCGSRLNESLVMMKSAIAFRSSYTLRFIIISDYDLHIEFDNILKIWRKRNSFSYELYNLSFPKDTGNEWRNLFKPCASQRLFLTDILTHLDAVLYVDTDVVFLSPLTDIWKYFKYMNESQIAALVPEHEDTNNGWYNRFARHPFYGKLGVNSGVMLMNLTGMRLFKWVSQLRPIYKQYKLKLEYGDQDIINIIFHYHPDKLYIYPCHYNYRSDHCVNTSVCKSAEDEGIIVLHGSRGTFHSNEQPPFKAIYDVLNEYVLGPDLHKYLLTPMVERLNQVPNTGCGAVNYIFTKNIKKHLEENNDIAETTTVS